ncbi:Cadherin-23 [Halotydeus destructor]|nr:Cadherin-23 [Halotydeus destructor]
MTQVAVRWMSIMALVMSVRHDRLAGLPMWAEAAYSAPNFPPKFVSTDGTSYASEIIVHVREGPTDVGKQIARLVGKDADNDHLTFGVMGTIASEIVRVENSGDNEANVYLRKELDRETRDSYAVVLTLTDGKLGKGNFITRTMLIIVEDINDEAPVFRPFRTTIRLSEDASPAIVETVEALDADEGSFGQVLYRLEEVDKDLSAPATFAIETNQSKGIISLVGKLDFERKSFHQLKIIAYDQAPEGQRKTATAMLLVKIDDAEDEDPIFTVVPSVTRVPENQRPGTQVLRVAAIDGDRGVNNPVSYRINKGRPGPVCHRPADGNCAG